MPKPPAESPPRILGQMCPKHRIHTNSIRICELCERARARAWWRSLFCGLVFHRFDAKQVRTSEGDVCAVFVCSRCGVEA